MPGQQFWCFGLLVFDEVKAFVILTPDGGGRQLFAAPLNHFRKRNEPKPLNPFVVGRVVCLICRHTQDHLENEHYLKQCFAETVVLMSAYVCTEIG
jgi:hypothetical protein